MVISPLLSFLAGIASVISPCVLPVIPALIGYILMEKKKTEIISFIFGLNLIFLLIITLTIIFTAALNYYLYYIRIISAILLVVLGFFLLKNKYFHFSLIVSSNKDKGFLGGFLWGFIVSLAWASCYTPYLIALIAYSVYTANPIITALNLISYVLGFSITLFTLGMLISKINIKKLSGYSYQLRIIAGLLIILTGLYLLWLAI